MSSRFVQFLLFFMSRSFSAWVLILVLPAMAGAENGKVTRPRPISDGMKLVRQGIAGNMCALTFDDGPSQYTAQLLDILKEYRVKATFFVVGAQVERRPEIIRRMLEEGHEVGNHSYSHHTLRRMPATAQEADLRKMDALLRSLGANPRFVRPPYGSYDHNTVNAVQEMDGHLVMWSVDSQDWRKTAHLEDLNKVQLTYSGAPLRGVFLFHDTRRLTVELMPRILTTLAATDCHFVTLSEYIDSPKQTAEASRIAVQTPADAPLETPVAIQARPQPQTDQVLAKADPAAFVSGLPPISIASAQIIPISAAAPETSGPDRADSVRPSVLDPILESFFRLFHPPSPSAQRAALRNH
jgi:peptidoglycan/xylan/chitin deacetylase (PgdA/CDA1 family)